MDFFKNLPWLIIRFVCWLGWFSTFALAQLDISEGITGSLNFPIEGLTCLGNLAAFLTSLIRGRLDLEMGARDVIDILASPKLKPINGIKHEKGLTTTTEGRQTDSLERLFPAASTERNQQNASMEGGPGTAPAERAIFIEGGGLEPMERVGLQAASIEGGPEAASTDSAAISIDGGGLEPMERVGLHATSIEGGPEAASTDSAAISIDGGGLEPMERVGLQAPSIEGGPEAASTDENVLCTEGGGLEITSTEEGPQTTSTRQIVPQISDTEAHDFTKNRGLEAASVVILSTTTPNWFMKQFMRFNAPIAHSILLQSLPFNDAMKDVKVLQELTSQDTRGPCVCQPCKCMVFWTVEKITIMVARRVPGTLKQLSDSLCLLPCLTCLRKGCHECDQHLLYVDDSGRLTEGGPEVNSPAVVCQILDDINGRSRSIRAGEPICICIPMNDAHCDHWTKLLLRSFRSKDAAGRGVTVAASEALEGYLAQGRRGVEGSVEYNIFPFILPRLAEVAINVVLTLWFRMDGFSSALLARRAIRDYLVDSKGSGFAANAFLTKGVVKSDADNKKVCQVLTFRSNILYIIAFMFTGYVNLISSVAWAVLISFDGGFDSSPAPSVIIVIVIIVFILIGYAIDVVAVITADWNARPDRKLAVLCTLTLFTEMTILCHASLFTGLLAVAGILFVFVQFVIRCYQEICRTYRGSSLSAMHSILLFGRVDYSSILLFGRVDYSSMWLFGRLFYSGPKHRMIITMCLPAIMYVTLYFTLEGASWAFTVLGRSVYGGLQILVWMKWTTGAFMLNHANSFEFFGKSLRTWDVLVYCSAFLLNAALAGVRCKWEQWPWRHNHLFSRKLGP